MSIYNREILWVGISCSTKWNNCLALFSMENKAKNSYFNEWEQLIPIREDESQPGCLSIVTVVQDWKVPVEATVVDVVIVVVEAIVIVVTVDVVGGGVVTAVEVVVLVVSVVSAAALAVVVIVVIVVVVVVEVVEVVVAIINVTGVVM